MAPTPKPANPPATKENSWNGEKNGDSQSLAQGIDGKSNPELGLDAPVVAKPAPAADKPVEAAAKPVEAVAKPVPAAAKPVAPKAPEWDGTESGDSSSLAQGPVTAKPAALATP